jgi:alkylation response protein AidB-like acyl-CoA dehydrogenase
MSRTYDILGKVGNEQAFRQEMRDWLAEKAPKNWRQIWQSVRDSALKAEVVKWLNERRAVGLGTPHWPKEWGGPGLPFAYQIMVYEEFWHCGLLLRLPILPGSTHFIIQQLLPEIGSEMQGP